MKNASVILLSWGLTLLLLALNYSLYRNRGREPRAKQTLISVTNTVKRVVRFRPSTQAGRPMVSKFNWASIEADDYANYIANLRAIGCPEKTIRDLILADVDKQYELRQRQVDAASEQVFWRTGAQVDADHAQYERQTIALVREKFAVIQNLLGIDIDTVGLRLWQHTDMAAYLLGYLPEPKPERVTSLYLRAGRQSEALDRIIGNIVTPVDQGEQEQLYRAIRLELGQMLTPAETEELQIRLAALDGKNKLLGIEVNGEELRQFARTLAVAADPIREIFKLPGELSDEDIAAANKKRDDAIKLLLGPTRFVDYERAQDDRYREVFSLTEKNELPKSTAIKIYEIRQAADAQAERTRQDPALTDEERVIVLNTLRTQTERAFALYLGPKAFEEYRRDGGHWLDQISRESPPGEVQPATLGK